MGSLIVVLVAVAVCCSETRCDILPATTVVKPEDRGFLMKTNVSHAIDTGFSLRNLGLLKPTKIEELGNVNSTSSESNKRKARILGSLAFLAGMSFGGLATAASSNVKAFAKMPQASFVLNLGSKTTPHFAAYYSPYSFVPYPFFYHPPFGLLPSADPPKPSQVSSHNDATPQVISVFDNRQPGDFAESNEEEYADQKKTPDDGKSAADGEDGAEHRPELRAEVDRNAEEKMVIRGCKEAQRKHGNSFKGSPKEREDLQVDADDSAAALKATNTTADTNQTVVRDRTTKRPHVAHRPTKHHKHHSTEHLTQDHHSTERPMQNNQFTEPPTHNIQPTEPPTNNIQSTEPSAQNNRSTENPTQNNTSTDRPFFPGYFEGYPQDIGHVDFTTDSDVYHYQDHGQINYNLPYERPIDFYHDDVYSNHQVGPYFPGSFPTNQINGYVGTGFSRVYPTEYQPLYGNGGFKPVK